MFIDLEPIFNNEGSRFDFDYEFKFTEDAGDSLYNTVGVVHIFGAVKNRSGMVDLDASAEFDYSADCDRCAEFTVKKLRVSVKHLLIAKLNNGDNDDYILVSNLRLDLDELVREDIVLDLPSVFLCRENCRGLCTECGANLNDGECGCKKPQDPRLEALKGLLDD